MPKVVITMPAYRAATTLERTVADIPPGIADRLILVDDASPDNTAELARGLGIDVHVHVENLGYGGNQKTCYIEALRSGADIVVLLHPDYQYEPKAVPLLIAPIIAGDADMTFGSRFAGLGDPIGGGMPLYRFVGNRVTTIAENLMLGSRFSELHSGLRAYSRRCLLSLPVLSYSDDFVFDSQLLIDAVTLGQRVVEVPIPTRYTKESSSIAVGRSLAYIAGTLGYCAGRSARRGRRGRRSIVARANAQRTVEAVPSAGVTATRQHADVELPQTYDLLLAVSRFLGPGNSLVIFTTGNGSELLARANALGWEAFLAAGDGRNPEDGAPTPSSPNRRNVSREQQRSDAAVVVTPVEESTDDLAAARANVNFEAVVAVRATSAELARAALTAVGFRMVEWIPHSRQGPILRSVLRTPSAGIAVARPQ